MNQINQEELKLKVGREIAARVVSGEVLGVGTGSTVEAALLALQHRLKTEKLDLAVLTTSWQSAWRCQELGFRVLNSSYTGDLAWGFDGADAVDTKLRVIKGRGGAMLLEKVMAARCKELVILVDETKFADNIAEKAAIPVELIPETVDLVQKALFELGAKSLEVRQAKAKYGPVITEKGNIIIDAWFPVVTPTLERDIKSIIGVVESGLFTSFATEVLIASNSGVKSIKA